MTKRCAIVCPIATGGGVTESFLTSLDMLNSEGITPTAIIPEGFVFRERLSKRGYSVYTIRNLERGGYPNLVWQALAIGKAVRRTNAEILILNNGRHIRIVKFFVPTIPVVGVYHGGKVSRFLTADRIITINEDQRQLLITNGYPSTRVAVVDNALPVETLPNYTPKERKGSDVVVGTLRLLEKAKGVDILLEAIGILARRGKMLRTRVGSSGSQAEVLKRRAVDLGIDGNVEFCGWIQDKAAFFDSLDIYVLPSRTEEWGIGIVEANAARVPVIATACLGPKRIVCNRKTGVLVPVEDPLAMANAIEELVDNPVMAEQLAHAAYEYCEKNFLFSRIAPIFVCEVLRVARRCHSQSRGSSCA